MLVICARLTDGSVACLNSAGTQFAPVAGITEAVDVSAGEYQVCAVTSDGHVWCWGQNPFGELGTLDQTAIADGPAAPEVGPTMVPGVDGAVEVRASGRYTCAVLTSGQVTCWGDNTYGTLGTNDLPVTEPCNPDNKLGLTDTCSTPVLVPGVENAIHIATANDHVCAVLADGTVECWGSGSQCP
jgi:alpha-tubulin suppressor-like RCC1 family protein